MSKLREAAQAVEDELRNQHKAFASWFLGLHATTTLDPEDLAWSAWKAACRVTRTHMTLSIPLWVLYLLALPLIVVGSVALAIGLWFLWMWATGRLTTWN